MGSEPRGTTRQAPSGAPVLVKSWSVPPVRVLLGCQEAPRAKSTRPSPSISRPLEAHVVGLGRFAEDVVLGPTGALVPDDGVAGNGHNVGLAVAIDVAGGDRINKPRPPWGRSPAPRTRGSRRRPPLGSGSRMPRLAVQDGSWWPFGVLLAGVAAGDGPRGGSRDAFIKVDRREQAGGRLKSRGVAFADSVDDDHRRCGGRQG